MRIAFVGKGGSGKTTAAALFCRHLAADGRPVLAIDADINQHLAAALGEDRTPPHSLSADLRWLKEHLRGDNTRITSADVMIKTTPPGRGSRLVGLDAADEVLRHFATTTAEGVRYLVTGPIEQTDVGVRASMRRPVR